MSALPLAASVVPRICTYGHRLRTFVVWWMACVVLLGNQHSARGAGEQPVHIDRVSSERIYLVEPYTAGVKPYIDRDYVLRELPPGLQPLTILRTSNEDDRVADAQHIQLTLARPAMLYVAWDQQAKGPAAWLQGWDRVKGTISTNHAPFVIYRRKFPAGKVTLGGNDRRSTGAASHYLVLLGEDLTGGDLEVAHRVDAKHVQATAANGVQQPLLYPPSKPPLVPAGFRTQLVAREPLIHNPCALCFDDQGRLVVGFGPQYRKPQPDTPGDRVAMLIDDNDDGVTDRVHTFAQGFNCIQALAWRGDELWVANAPDLTVVRDTDGDDVADEYTRVFTDLGNLEHGLHGLQWAPDGWLYMSKGNSKGHNRPEEDGRVAPRAFRELFGLAHPDGANDLPPSVTFSAQDYPRVGKGYHHPSDDWGREGGVLRFQPEARKLEIVAQGFRNPWDIAFDATFDWLGTDNDQDQGDKVFTPFWGAHFGWGHPWSYRWNDPQHLPTVAASAPLFEGSGTGVLFYSASQFPEAFRQAFFVNDWLQQATFLYRSNWRGAVRQPTSSDAAFELFADQPAGGLYKPTDIEVGPEGALYVASWGVEYGVRWKVGETNQTQTNEGRIYRIWYTGNKLPTRADWNGVHRAQSRDQWTVDQLVADLGGDALPTWRVNAQVELIRRGEAVRQTLETRLEAASADSVEQTWLLWTLGRLSMDDPAGDEHLQRYLQHEDRNLRIQTLRVLALRARANPATSLPSSVARLCEDKDAKVRFAAVQALWQAQDRDHYESIVELLESEQDPLVFYSCWQSLRTLCTLPQRRSLLDDSSANVRLAALLGLLQDFALTKEEVLARVEESSDPRFQKWALKWVLAGKPPRTVSNQRERVASKDQLSAEDLIAQLEFPLRDATAEVLFTMLARYPLTDALWARARRVYQNRMDTRPPPHPGHVAAMLSALGQSQRANEELWESLRSAFTEVRAAAAKALGGREDGRAFVVARLDAKVTPRQHEALALLAAEQSAGTSIPLTAEAAEQLCKAFGSTQNAITRGNMLSLLAQMDPALLSATLRRQITDVAKRAASHPDPRVFALAPAVAQRLGITLSQVERTPVTVSTVLEQLEGAEPQLGKEIFSDRRRANCLNCHQLGQEGKAFAPSLADVGKRLSAEQIATAILHPSQKITEGFHVTNFVLADGRVLSGVVQSETATAVNLFQANGETEVVAKQDIDHRASSQVSIMPANFGLLLTRDELADLVAWLQTRRDVPPAGGMVQSASANPPMEVALHADRVVFTALGQPVATYRHADPEIPRPYLAQVFAPGGIQVTRNHPPQPGDPTDHANYHPGVFLAFGDLNGHDYWRLKARVEHGGFTVTPNAVGNQARMVARHQYRSTDGQDIVCSEQFSLTITATQDHYQLDWESVFTSPTGELIFGDQEEMGLGVRMASPLRELGGGGRILNSRGQESASATWGQSADWCDYGGTVGDEQAGVLLIPSPRNFRPAWWHNRDYGLFVANPFGRRAMRQGEPSQWVVPRDAPFRLAFRLLLHAGNPPDGQTAWEAYAEAETATSAPRD